MQISKFEFSFYNYSCHILKFWFIDLMNFDLFNQLETLIYLWISACKSTLSNHHEYTGYDDNISAATVIYLMWYFHVRFDDILQNTVFWQRILHGNSGHWHILFIVLCDRSPIIPFIHWLNLYLEFTWNFQAATSDPISCILPFMHNSAFQYVPWWHCITSYVAIASFKTFYLWQSNPYVCNIAT